ncbi:ATP-binding cassette domain-containing protein [Helicobacter labacensis]|uniref:ATP-binding cassette domain-containing protein n=1 Tax=Helicobacter labacensis TaxID=2316079 RepID=UPI000EB52EAB|nr:ATP-binding cassette domain-containing protein [Helicobacter labacensis]
MRHSNIFRVFSLLYVSAPKYMCMACALVVLVGVLPSLSVAITIKLINFIALALQHHSLEYKPLLTILSLGALALFGSLLGSQILAHWQTLIAEAFSMRILSTLADKLETTHDLHFLEDKERSVQINTLKNGLHIRPLNYVNNLFFNSQRLIGLFSLLVVISSISLYLPFVMLLASVPSLLLSNYIAKKHSQELDALQAQKEALQNYLQLAWIARKIKIISCLILWVSKIYAIVGKNASGKSTLIKLLMGFYTPSSGEIIINHQ